MTSVRLKESEAYLRKNVSSELSRINKELRLTVGKLSTKANMDPQVIQDVLDNKPGLSIRGLAKIAEAMNCKVKVTFIPYKEN